MNTGGITGLQRPCRNSTVTYSIPAATGASSYQWSLPPGATGTSTTNTITVNYNNQFNGGLISVVPVNQCGLGTAVTLNVSRSLSVPTGPLSITSYAGASGSGVYTVNALNGADTYTWSVSDPAATIVSGQGTTAIELQIQPGYTGTIILQVRASNCKGNGAVGTLAVIVNPQGRQQQAAVQMQQELLMVYPNPNSGVFTVKTMSLAVDAKLEIYSMDGRLVRSEIIPANTTETSIELLQPAAGLYQVRLVAGDEVRSVKIIVR